MHRKLFKQFFTILTLEVLFCTVGADTTDTEGTEGAGGKMGYDRKSTSKYQKDEKYQNDRDVISNVGDSSTGYSDVADMMDTMFTDQRTDEQKALQEARIKSFLSGFPVVGPFFQGVEKAQQLEDLYKNTGKVPAYPATSGIGYGGIGYAASNAAFSANRIANGFHDLYHFYSGEPDHFRQMMNGAYL